MSVCVVPLSQPSSRDLIYPLLGCFVSEKSSIIKKNTLLELEKAVGEFLIREKRDGNPILPIIYDLLRELENSTIPLSEQLRLKMLIDDIDQNQYTVFKW